MIPLIFDEDDDKARAFNAPRMHNSKIWLRISPGRTSNKDDKFVEVPAIIEAGAIFEEVVQGRRDRSCCDFSTNKTCTCSHRVNESMEDEAVRQAASVEDNEAERQPAGGC